MQDPIDGDEAEHVAVAKGAAAQRQVEVLAVGRERPRRMFGRGERHPGVAAKAAVPAQTIVLTNEQAVLGPDVGGIGAYQLVAVQSAPDQLVAQLRQVAPRLLGARRGRRFLATLVLHREDSLG